MSGYGDDWVMPKVIGMAERVHFNDARRAFQAGQTVLITEDGRESFCPVTTISTVHSKAKGTNWDELVEQVRMWRSRYPYQRWYIVEYFPQPVEEVAK